MCLTFYFTELAGVNGVHVGYVFVLSAGSRWWTDPGAKFYPLLENRLHGTPKILNKKRV